MILQKMQAAEDMVVLSIWGGCHLVGLGVLGDDAGSMRVGCGVFEHSTPLTVRFRSGKRYHPLM